MINYSLAGSAPILKNLFVPIYNMIPQNGAVADFVFVNPLGGQIHLLASVRSDSDYGVNVSAIKVPGSVPLLRSKVTFWGDPADPSHDHERGECLSIFFGPSEEESCPSSLPPRPFLSNPTHCDTEDVTKLSINTWEHPATIFEYDSEPQTFEACNELEFEPSIEAKPTTNLADSPSGLDFNLRIPQNEDPDGRATAHLKDATVTLPAGLSVNAASANGLGACSPAQVGLTTSVGNPQAHFTAEPANCPDSSKLGTVSVETPVLDHPVPGEVFLASQNQNPFNSLLALYITLNDPETGIVAKIPAEVSADPVTGQLTTTVSEAPQLPFEDMHLSFFKGAAAPLKTAINCATFTTNSDLTPWSTPEGADAFPSDSFEITAGAGGAPCVPNEAAAPNSPSFEAGTVDPVAGAYSPFVLRLARQDGSQRLRAIEATLPQGLLAKLAGTTYCPEAALSAAAAKSGQAEQSSPSCPASSRVGAVNVAAGAGPAPYHAQGSAYLAGPYKGAPLSLAVITPAVAGPFDLGTVLVRTALQVDPESAQVKAISDPFPSILQGIPLDIRSVAVNLERQSFTRNPTSCDPLAITGAAVALSGQSAAIANPFQVGDCKKLSFKPKLSLRLKGQTGRGGFPALRATLKMPSQGANIARATVTLPHSEFLAQSHIRTICTRVQFAAQSCPKGSVYGHARASTPLLDEPLQGPVYLRSSSNPLPDLVADLGGQLHVVLVGRIDSTKGGGIRTSFASVPDAPVSKFVLTMQGGRKGLFENSRNLCNSTSRATVLFDAHNAKVADSRPVVRARCGKGRKGH